MSSDEEVEVVLVEEPMPRLRLVTFKAREDLVERLDELAKRLGKSRSEVIREAIEHYLALSRAGSDPTRYVRLPELLGVA